MLSIGTKITFDYYKDGRISKGEIISGLTSMNTYDVKLIGVKEKDHFVAGNGPKHDTWFVDEKDCIPVKLEPRKVKIGELV